LRFEDAAITGDNPMVAGANAEKWFYLITFIDFL
jgi:hypothetical protein